MKTSPEDRATENFPVESYDDRVQRITKRELIRSHRALPVLVESLLFCAEINKQKNEPSLPIDLILNICGFSQKMKWLCSWGAEIIDEAGRPPSTSKPRCIQEKVRSFIASASRDRMALKTAKILSLLQDSKQNWDRICLDTFHSTLFESLHLHPCEELRFTNLTTSLSREDARNIGKCINLRIIDMDVGIVPSHVMLELQRLPYLRILISNRFCFTGDSFRTNIHLPRVTNFSLIDLDRASTTEMSEMLSCIHSRRNTARQIHLEVSQGQEIFEALAQCTQVQSIRIDGFPESYETDYHILFASPNLQKTVRHIHMVGAYLGGVNLVQRAFNFLQKFRNVHWLEFCNMSSITVTDIGSIVRANAHHLCTLTVSNCNNIGDALFDAIAISKSLHSVDLIKTGVTPEGIYQYCGTKKPHWQNLNYIMHTVNPTRIPNIFYRNNDREGVFDEEILERWEWMDLSSGTVESDEDLFML